MQAVYSIHEERIVHSDLKPANFLMVEGQLKLIDFGIAKAIQAGEWWGQQCRWRINGFNMSAFLFASFWLVEGDSGKQAGAGSRS
jgi:serine/threonine protein kinase